MALFDDKKNVFTTIGAYVSLIQNEKKNLDELRNLYPSINNKDDIVPFLLDVLKTTVGTDALKDLTGELFTNLIDKIEPKLKDVLNKQFMQFNAGIELPTQFKNFGYTVQLKNVDVFGKFKTNPNSDVGDLLYNTAQENFDKRAYDAILNETTEIDYGNMLIKYDSLTDSFNFRANPASVNATTKIGDWFGDYINNTVLIDRKEFLTNVMNAVYGSVTAQQGKTIDEAYQELQVSKLIEQLIDDDNDSFELSQDDFDALLQKAQELVDGMVYYDMGCGLMGASLPFSGLSNLITQISGSTDPHGIGNAIDATIDESTTNTPEVTAENRETIKDGFFQRIIRIITQMLGQIMTTSPQIRALLAIKSAIENNGTVLLESAVNDLKNFKVIIKCIVKEAMKLIYEFIFDYVVLNLVAMLVPIVKKILKEKINQYTSILKSLIT